jgi:hypothetical protein
MKKSKSSQIITGSEKIALKAGVTAISKITGNAISGHNLLSGVPQTTFSGVNLGAIVSVLIKGLLGDKPIDNVIASEIGTATGKSVMALSEGKELTSSLFNFSESSISRSGTSVLGISISGQAISALVPIIGGIIGGLTGALSGREEAPGDCILGAAAGIIACVPGIGWVLSPIIACLGFIVSESPSKAEMWTDAQMQALRPIWRRREENFRKSFFKNLGVSDTQQTSIYYILPISDLQKLKGHYSILTNTGVSYIKPKLFHFHSHHNDLIKKAIDLKKRLFNPMGIIIPSPPENLWKNKKASDQIHVLTMYYLVMFNLWAVLDRSYFNKKDLQQLGAYVWIMSMIARYYSKGHYGYTWPAINHDWRKGYQISYEKSMEEFFSGFTLKSLAKNVTFSYDIERPKTTQEIISQLIGRR